MFVRLLKHPKSRLDSERHPRVPWPRYSRKLTFQHSRPTDFCAGLSEGVDLWSKLSNPEVTGVAEALQL